MNSIRKHIIDILHKNKNKYISGAEISQNLDVSRTTVSNHIKELRKKGYQIHSKTNKGYFLEDIPEKIVEEEIYHTLKTEMIGKNIKCFDEVLSTNTRAKKLAESMPSGTLVIAEQQTKGKGRRGRKWFSPAGEGLWFSLILCPDIEPEKLPLLTMAGALAVKEALDKYPKLESLLKWPNDVLIRGKKVCGILSEINAEIDKINYAVTGIGINVNQNKFPDELAGKAISIKKVLKKRVNRYKLLGDILLIFEKYYQKIISGKEEAIINLWKSNLNILQKTVSIEREGKTYQGRVIDLSSRGELILKDKNNKIHNFWTGDTSIIDD